MSLFKTKHIVLMGVSGCGKSTIGAFLSQLSGLPYLDGDDLHPAANVEKMRSGVALNDDDRWPWLDACAQSLSDASTGLILGCSALRRVYRDRLRTASALPDLHFVYLHGSEALLSARLSTRAGHYMPSSLLDSQLATLEVPQPDETSTTVNIDQTLDRMAQDIVKAL